MHQREFIPKDSIERRVKARVLAFQAVFQYDIQACGDKGILDFFLRENSDDELVRQLAREWAFGTIECQDELDQMLSTVIKRWKPTALMPVEKAILRLSVYQLKHCDHIPGKVVINEAIELAKKFSTENSPGFVNGILDAILRKLNSEESEIET
ncbi:MAG: transcription antitermination factor NusB [Sedimentisphaeraceae bacterium JB056]